MFLLVAPRLQQFRQFPAYLPRSHWNSPLHFRLYVPQRWRRADYLLLLADPLRRGCSDRRFYPDLLGIFEQLIGEVIGDNEISVIELLREAGLAGRGEFCRVAIALLLEGPTGDIEVEFGKGVFVLVEGVEAGGVELEDVLPLGLDVAADVVAQLLEVRQLERLLPVQPGLVQQGQLAQRSRRRLLFWGWEREGFGRELH